MGQQNTTSAISSTDKRLPSTGNGKPELDEIYTWDWPDTERVPDDGWALKEVPSISRQNFEFVQEKLNELIAAINELRTGK